MNCIFPASRYRAGSMKAPLPADEAARLAALRACDILDTPAEEAYDDIVYLATQICKMPIGMVSLVDEHRQWFKAKIGVETPETPRDMAFCAHAILRPDQMFVVPDATQDERFAENHLVTFHPHIRFYAGAPLRSASGHALGTLCVIDQVPRKLDAEQAKSLQALSRQLSAQLELRRSLTEGRRLIAELKAAMAEVKTLSGLLPVCAWCKKVRDDKGYWQSVEGYIQSHTETRITHGICPACVAKLETEKSPTVTPGPSP